VSKTKDLSAQLLTITSKSRFPNHAFLYQLWFKDHLYSIEITNVIT